MLPVEPMRGLIAALLMVGSLLLLGTETPSAAAREPAAQFAGSVGVGDALFWDGELYVDGTAGANLPHASASPLGAAVETCGAADNPDPCWAYRLAVVEEADTLRVGIDLRNRADCYQVELWAPGAYDDPLAGPVAVDLRCPELLTLVVSHEAWNRELSVSDPAVGTWTVRVVPFLVAGWGFRLRATLVDELQPVGKALLPNLQTYPPYELGFVAPASPAAGIAPDKQNPPGPAGVSCTADELAEAAEHERHPERCLRFSAGIYNVGDGPLELVTVPDDPTFRGGPVVQRIRRDDGEVAQEREAGTWHFHLIHGHPHYDGFADYELYRVRDASSPALDPQGDRRLELTSDGHKPGWGPTDQRFADWLRFDQAPADKVSNDCSERGEGCIGQSNGWGDHYRWQRPGQYVEFPVNADGTGVDGDYVVRMVVDRDDRVLESDDRDNSAYAWIRVRGEQVRICERGVGHSPWDPHKRIHVPSFWLSTPGGTTADSATGDCD